MATRLWATLKCCAHTTISGGCAIEEKNAIYALCHTFFGLHAHVLSYSIHTHADAFKTVVASLPPEKKERLEGAARQSNPAAEAFRKQQKKSPTPIHIQIHALTHTHIDNPRTNVV